jgi:hypothetical protein
MRERERAKRAALAKLHPGTSQNQPYLACSRTLRSAFVGQGKDIVYRFIMKYSSLMDFGPY